MLSGPTRVGEADSCLAAFSGATTVSYAWQANGATIGKATSASYKISASLFGKTLTCSVTASNAAGSVSGTSSGAKVARGPALVPVKKPVLFGPHLAGKAEGVTNGKWSPAAGKITYQWYVGKTRIAGATKSTFSLPKKDIGKTVQCIVTASATGYTNGRYVTPAVRIT